MKALILGTIILFLSSATYAKEASKYTYSDSEEKEVSGQKGDGKKGGVLARPTGVAVKGGRGKSVAVFPDVCVTPPSAPGGEENIEKPNSADTEGGKSKSTKIDGMRKTSYKKYMQDKKIDEGTSSQNRKRRERLKRARKLFFKK